jgi:Uma2 family endonuclease
MSVADITSPPTRVDRRSNGMLMTADEYDAIDSWDERYRYELVHGVLIVSPPPSIGERSPNDYLGHLLWSYRESHADGAALDDTAPEQEIRIGENRRRADRAIWVGLDRPVDPVADVPAIAVEFVSDSSRDRHRDFVEKRREYAAAGVKEYWVIDRFRREMTVLRGADENVRVAENEIYQTPLLPGFELPLAVLLAKADQYAAPAEPDEA